VPRCEGKRKRRQPTADFYAYSYGLWGAVGAVSSPSAIRHPVDALRDSRSRRAISSCNNRVAGLRERNLIEM